MLTADELYARVRSVRSHATACIEKCLALSKTARKLGAYNTLLEPPEPIKTANEVHAERLEKESDELYDLYKKFDRITAALWALPTVNDFNEAIPGYLPGGGRSSKDEAEARRMLVDYYAANEASA